MSFNPLTPTVGTIKHPVSYRVKPSFVIFDIRVLIFTLIPVLTAPTWVICWPTLMEYATLTTKSVTKRQLSWVSLLEKASMNETSNTHAATRVITRYTRTSLTVKQSWTYKLLYGQRCKSVKPTFDPLFITKPINRVTNYAKFRQNFVKIRQAGSFIHCVQKENTHSHFLSYLHEWCVDSNKNCSEYTYGTVDCDNVEIRY